MSNGFWGNMWISCFFIATFHQIAVYSLCLGRSWILIHLMLKFIAKLIRLIIWLLNFNTSHVRVYQWSCKIQSVYLLYFNTSHVKVYPEGATETNADGTDFNTSHVKVYQRCRQVWIRQYPISIHLMLKFIQVVLLIAMLAWRFQYISC